MINLKKILTSIRNKNNFDYKYIIIIILIVIIILTRGCENKNISNTPSVITKYDTVYKETHDTIKKKVFVSKTEYVPFEKIVFVNVETCMKEYNKKTTYKDTIVLDSIGTIRIIDTVFQNTLKERTIFKDYKIPFVTKTVTVTKQAEPRRQLYIGGNLFGDKNSLQLASPGILYKTKKDHIYQANVGINFDGSIIYGVGVYYKIKLK
jgi:hypothetical protein